MRSLRARGSLDSRSLFDPEFMFTSFNTVSQTVHPIRVVTECYLRQLQDVDVCFAKEIPIILDARREKSLLAEKLCLMVMTV